jgi:type II secretory pathway component PulK
VRGKLKSDKRSGFALMVVIVILMLVSFLASQLIMQVRTELRMAANAGFRTTGRLLAESGVNLALFRLLDKLEPGTETTVFEEADFLLGRPYETDLPTGKIEYYAVNEAGKINLNSPPTGLLQAFLEYQGLEPDEVAVVLDSLADWRDSDSLYRINGAEEDYYQSLEPPYSPRNGNLEDVAEFFLIKGTAALRGRFDPYEVFSVSAGGKAVNFNSLTPAMVDFLVESDADKLALYREMKDIGLSLTANQAQEILGPERFAILRSYLSYDLIKSNQYSIVSTGFADKGKRQESGNGTDETAEYHPGVVVRVLVEIGANGFTNLSWRERYL